MTVDRSATRGQGGWRRCIDAASAIVFLISVAFVARHTLALSPSRDTSTYQSAVRDAVRAVPRTLGEWVGIDVTIPVQAQNLLRPTAFLSRRYVNQRSGEACIVTIVHCSDARDMFGHFPPACYPGQGWLLESTTANDVALAFGTLRATDYEFSRGRFGAISTALVTNSMLLPNGTTSRDMDGVERTMDDVGLRFYGVAQVQIFFDQPLAASRRAEIVTEMLEVHRNCIVAIVRQPRLS